MKSHINGIRVIPTEDEEQSYIFNWSSLNTNKYPDLVLMYHIPNEGKRSYREGAKQKSIGLKKGVPDICLPVARGKYHGLYIELKALDGKLTDNQQKWIDNLNAVGFRACVCYGAKAAIAEIEKYLNEENI